MYMDHGGFFICVFIYVAFICFKIKKDKTI